MTVKVRMVVQILLYPIPSLSVVLSLGRTLNPYYLICCNMYYQGGC